MPIQPITLRTDERSKPLDVLGVGITVLASNSATGACEVTVQEGDEGIGPPPHSHPWDETFYVLSGSVQLVCGDRQLDCETGAFVHIPAGTVHAFQFGPGGGEMLEFTGRGGKAVKAFSDLACDVDPKAPDITQVINTLQNNGVTVHL